MKQGRRFGVNHAKGGGSVVLGMATEAGDIDRWVHFEPHWSQFDVIGFQQDWAELLGVKVGAVEEGGLLARIEAPIMPEANAR